MARDKMKYRNSSLLIIYGRVHECRDSVVVERIIVERQVNKAKEEEDNIGDKNCYVVFQLPIKTR